MTAFNEKPLPRPLPEAERGSLRPLPLPSQGRETGVRSDA